jgi:hypothetical protein
MLRLIIFDRGLLEKEQLGWCGLRRPFRFPPPWRPRIRNRKGIPLYPFTSWRKERKGSSISSRRRHFDKPDGSIMHAEVHIGDTVVMIADASSAYHGFPV